MADNNADGSRDLLSVNNEEVVMATNTLRVRSRFRLNMELPFFCMFFGVALSGAVINNMLLERACLSLGYDETVCEQLRHPAPPPALEAAAQGVVTLVTMAQAVLEGVWPAVLSMFLGVWSNEHGRKPLFTWPLFGFALTSIALGVYSLVPLGPWWVLATALPYSLGGGGSALFTGAFCHLSDVTTSEDRSFRLSILETSVFAGMILGSLASPYTQSALGTPRLLLVAAALAVAAYVYANLCVRESVVNARPGGLRSVLDVSLVKDMLKTCFKRRPNFDRAAILLLVGASSLNIFILYGLFNIDYMYARKKLQWDLKQYSVYTAVNTSVLVVGMLLGVGILQKRFKFSDGVMIMVAILSSVVDMACKALATASSSWLMYFGASVSLFRGLSGPLIRSLLSKRVADDDVAKVFALMSSFEAILPVLSPLVYSTLYKFTLQVLPETIYLLTMGLYGTSLIMIGFSNYFMKRYPEPYSVLAEN